MRKSTTFKMLRRSFVEHCDTKSENTHIHSHNYTITHFLNHSPLHSVTWDPIFSSTKWYLGFLRDNGSFGWYRLTFRTKGRLSSTKCTQTHLGINLSSNFNFGFFYEHIWIVWWFIGVTFRLERIHDEDSDRRKSQSENNRTNKKCQRVVGQKALDSSRISFKRLWLR